MTITVYASAPAAKPDKWAQFDLETQLHPLATRLYGGTLPVDRKKLVAMLDALEGRKQPFHPTLVPPVPRTPQECAEQTRAMMRRAMKWRRW